MYPFASLPENLVAFCAMLRRDYGFEIGPRQLQDSARALQVAAIADERIVRDTLRPILSSSLAQVLAFDDAFSAFFHRGRRPALVRPQAAADDAHETTGRSMRRRASTPESQLWDETESGIAGIVDVIAESNAPQQEADSVTRSTYSPLAGAGKPPTLGVVDQAWRDAAARLVRRVRTSVARRWKPVRRGPRFDLRRTLRSSLHTGGEPVLPRWQARARLRPRFVVIIDGSRSMSTYTAPALRLAVALASVTVRAEVFVFSTALRRITGEVRRAAAGLPRSLPELQHAWGGGTGIGICLRELILWHGDRVLGPETAVIVASDGLDVGRPEVLRQAMAELRRRSAAVIWLNPLIGTPGYEPTAIGMRVARPFVSTFSWVADSAGLRRLAQVVRVTF